MSRPFGIVLLVGVVCSHAAGQAPNYQRPTGPYDPGASSPNWNGPPSQGSTPRPNGAAANQGNPGAINNQAQAALGQPNGAAGQANPRMPPAAPFILKPGEERLVDALLLAWQDKQVKEFYADFIRWDYDYQWGPEKKDFLKAELGGLVRYQGPDKGQFKVETAKVYTPASKDKPEGYYPVTEGKEEWISDGKSIFEFDHRNKQLVEHLLPKNLQGQAIVDAPLPFVFGGNAAQLKERYWIRITTPANVNDKTWIEAYPRTQKDAANYKKVEVILVNATMTPEAIQMHLPGGQNRQAYMFMPKRKELLSGILGSNPFAPSTPSGWKLVKDDMGAAKLPPVGDGNPVAPATFRETVPTNNAGNGNNGASRFTPLPDVRSAQQPNTQPPRR